MAGRSRFGGNLLRTKSGQALPEFAFVSFALISLLFGIVDFGNALFTYDLVSSAARLGARYAMVRGSRCTYTGCPATTASIQTYVRSKAPGINNSLLTVSTTWANSSNCTTSNGPGCVVTVAVSYTYNFVYKLAPITISSSSSMVISQ